MPDKSIRTETGWEVCSFPYADAVANMDFIAAARELVPAMADEIERLRRELDSERAELQRYRWMNHEERSVQSTPPPSGEAVRAQ